MAQQHPIVVDSDDDDGGVASAAAAPDAFAAAYDRRFDGGVAASAAAAAAAARGDAWTCAACTLRNASQLRSCAVCATARPLRPPPDVVEIDA